MEPPVLVGARVRLRGVLPSDVTPRQRLGWHSEIERGYGSERGTGPMTDAEAAEWFELMATQDRFLQWVVEVEGEPAGMASLRLLNPVDRKALFAVGMHAPRFIGRGLGAEATRLVLGHAFDDLGLHRVGLRVLAFNAAAIACYHRCGFVEEGREREGCWLEGRWHDDVMMSVLDHEYRRQETPSG